MQDVQRKLTKNGDEYLSLKLRNKTVNFFDGYDVGIPVQKGQIISCRIVQKGYHLNGYDLKIVTYNMFAEATPEQNTVKIQEENPWAGGLYVDKRGYERFRSTKQLVHRYVMERHLGRKLTRQEVVHHINGIKADNSLSNLRLFATQDEHQRLYDRQYCVGGLFRLFCRLFGFVGLMIQFLK